MLFIGIMQELNLGALDLNLLVVLDALLAERHVTRAAARVGLSQPATSHALARLRAVFGDPLLVRGAGGAMVPTPRAEALAPRLRAALDGVTAALRGEQPFDPATARRTFRIATGDYAELVLLPALTARLAREAPGVDLWVVAGGEDLATLATGAHDCVLMPYRGPVAPAGVYEKKLFDETFTCVVRRGHPLVAQGQKLTLARYEAMPHLLIAPRGTPGSFVDDALAALGKQRRVALAVPHFLVAPHVVAATDLILTLATRIARAVAAPLDLVMMPPPVDLPGFTMSMWWHERNHHDPAQRWLRQVIAEVAGATPTPRAAASSPARPRGTSAAKAARSR
jgi:DNA-binding transcriptional LysR family regulator